MSETETSQKRPPIDGRWLAGLTVLPLIVAGVYLLAAWLSSQPGLRYAPRYFTSEYQERYDSPSSVVIDLERALRTDDRAAMEELSGLRRKPVFDTRENMRVTILYDTENSYWNYLFFDTQTYERFAHHLEEIDGRWVVAPEDLVYYYKSGEWWSTFMPLALIYWVVEIVVVLGVISYRISRGWRQDTLGW